MRPRFIENIPREATCWKSAEIRSVKALLARKSPRIAKPTPQFRNLNESAVKETALTLDRDRGVRRPTQ